MHSGLRSACADPDFSGLTLRYLVSHCLDSRDPTLTLSLLRFPLFLATLRQQGLRALGGTALSWGLLGTRGREPAPPKRKALPHKSRAVSARLSDSLRAPRESLSPPCSPTVAEVAPNKRQMFASSVGFGDCPSTQALNVPRRPPKTTIGGSEGLPRRHNSRRSTEAWQGDLAMTARASAARSPPAQMCKRCRQESKGKFTELLYLHGCLGRKRISTGRAAISSVSAMPTP